MTVPPDFGGHDIEEGLAEDLGAAPADHQAVSSQDEASAVLSDNKAHAAGQVCARCGAVITPSQDVRRRADGGWVHEECPLPGALPGAGDAVRVRRAGRVIVLDPDDRVLLFRYDDGPPNARHWCTPGGGLNDGEDYPAGARRELAEETGWTDVPVGSEVYERTLTMEYADAIVRQHERFFLARVDIGERGLGEVADMHVSDGIAAWHWWTLAELDATDEVIWPPGLADLIRRLTG
jgi:8-oxo-dGTP pyrophosphatase MutT (NUDIX family)